MMLIYITASALPLSSMVHRAWERKLPAAGGFAFASFSEKTGRSVLPINCYLKCVLRESKINNCDKKGREKNDK